MGKGITNIKEGSRYSQIFEADIYGGWVTAVTASVPEGILFTAIANGGIDTSLSEVSHEVQVVTKGNGENATFTVNLEGVDFDEGGAKTGVVASWFNLGKGSGYRSETVYETSTNGSGVGFSAILLVDRNGFALEIANVINYGSGYNVGDIISFDNPESRNPYTIQVKSITESSGGGKTYTSWRLKSVTPTILTKMQDKNGLETFQTFLRTPGTTKFHIDEVIRIPAEQLLETSVEYNIDCTVTDISYVNNIPSGKTRLPLINNANLTVLYDRWDKRHLIKVVNDGGYEYHHSRSAVFIHDFDGNDYTPSVLPEPTEPTNYTLTFEEDINPNAKIIIEFTNGDTTIDVEQKYGRDSYELNNTVGVMNTYSIDGKLVIEVNYPEPPYSQNFRIPRDTNLSFIVNCYDSLGYSISTQVDVYIAS